MENKRNSCRQDKLPWHLAFYQAMQMELFDYFDDIEMIFEHQLTSEPLRIDVLIVKKRKEIIIDKNIARIFRGHNIIEYKSPDDYFSVRDFQQVLAYAYHYAANTPDADDADLSLTFVGNRYPRALLRYLTEKRKYTIECSVPGIYLIRGDYFPIQIIESKRLPESESLWLHSLSNELRIDSARAILEASNDKARKMYIDAYLDVLMRSNRRAFVEVSNMRSKYPSFFLGIYSTAPLSSLFPAHLVCSQSSLPRNAGSNIANAERIWRTNPVLVYASKIFRSSESFA
jgi:hypothetical protein